MTLNKASQYLDASGKKANTLLPCLHTFHYVNGLIRRIAYQCDTQSLPFYKVINMSDVPSAVLDVIATAPIIAQPSVSVWPYVIAGIAATILAGFLVFKYISRPTFIINRIRKRNLKAMKKEGIESSEPTTDLDRLLTSIEKHAVKNNLSGTNMLKLLMPLNEQRRMATAKDMYLTMQHIAREISDNALATEFKNKSSGVRSNSKLMAGLLKRAGI